MFASVRREEVKVLLRIPEILVLLEKLNPPSFTATWY
jgi:hypothetical protein